MSLFTKSELHQKRVEFDLLNTQHKDIGFGILIAVGDETQPRVEICPDDAKEKRLQLTAAQLRHLERHPDKSKADFILLFARE